MAFPFHHVQALKTGEIRLNLLWEISIENKKHSLLRIIQDQRFQIINVKSIYDVHKIDWDQSGALVDEPTHRV